ncbi:MAG: 50S ribosomal protein L6 [Lentisphaeria bacterium]|nr:50S ribosomal protein L6 [Lentisphaeria bacterium]
MSRIGKKPIAIDGGAKVELAGRTVKISGPKGELTYELPDCVALTQEDSQLVFTCDGFETDARKKALYGLARSLVQNMVIGVTVGFKKELQIVGVGYRGQCQQNMLNLNLGFSHAVQFPAPEGIALSMPENTRIIVEGIDKQLVGQTAAVIRGFRPPDAYKGKGIRYSDEQISLKEGKTVG